MLKMVDGTGIIGVDMICPLGVSTPQPPNYDRVELEGAGILVLPNSLDAPLERLELGGKTEQVQTTGKNLLPDKFSIYAEGKSKTNLKLQIGNYVYSSKTSKNLYILHEDKSNITNGWTATNKLNFKIDKEETIEVRIETENPLEILPMIREETELDSYEPYTGGKPSPSQEYPQEIKNVGKWNEETQKYEVDVKITNAEQNWSKEQTLTITSDRPITKWDRLVEQGGQIGWLYTGVVIDRFDGQSNKISIANKQGNVQNFSIRFENVANGNGNSDIFVDKYRAVQLSYTKAEYGICCNWNDGVKYFSAPNENVATVDEFKAWLIENPLKIAYETTNPEFVPLPQSEQNAIRALKTYYPTTVITADGGELDPDIKVTYRKEI